MESEQHWDQARQVIKAWLKDQKVTPAKLAMMAKLQRSVVSRFLSGRPTSPSTAVKLFETIQPTLAFNDRLSLIEAFGLSRLSRLAKIAQDSLLEQVWHLAPPIPFQHEITSLINGTDLLIKALSIAPQQPLQAAQLCFLAEQAYKATPTNSLKAARVGLQMLINIGSYEEAIQELTRMSAIYRGVVEPRAETALLSARGWLEYDRGNLDDCIQAFKDQIQLAQQYGLTAEPEESKHFLALCYLAKGRSTHPSAIAQHYLHLAMQNMDESMKSAEKRGMSDVVIGFVRYRKGQILDAQGHFREAQKEFVLARSLMPPEAAHHIEIHQSEAWLNNGNTTKAKSIAENAFSQCDLQQYAAGFSRAARTYAQCQLQDGRLETALEYAVAAAIFDPYSWYGIQMQPINVIIVNLGDLVKHQYTQCGFELLLARLRTKVNERQGVFHHLTKMTPDRTKAIDDAFALFRESEKG